MKLYTVVVHNLQICMKEYHCCLKFRRVDDSTYTFTKRGVVYLVSATPPKRRSCAYSPSLHTERISEYKLNYLPFQIMDSDHISSRTSAGRVSLGEVTHSSSFLLVLQLPSPIQLPWHNWNNVQRSVKQTYPWSYIICSKYHTERISEYKLNYLPFQIMDSDHISSRTSAGSVLQMCKVS
jgi:hypothetical protein